MNNPLIQKVFKEVILHLTKRGSIKEVLIDALLEWSFIKLDEFAVTQQYQDQYKRVFAKVTKEKARGLEATFVASIQAMSEETAPSLVPPPA